MRNPRKAVQRLGLHTCGHLARDTIDTLLDERPHIIDDCVDAIGSEYHGGPNDDDVAECSRRLLQAFPDPGWLPPPHEDVETELNAELIESWRASSGDIDQHAAGWLRTGAPVGVDTDYDTCGVFSGHEQTS